MERPSVHGGLRLWHLVVLLENEGPRAAGVPRRTAPEGGGHEGPFHSRVAVGAGRLDDPNTRDGWLRSRMLAEGDVTVRGCVAAELIQVGLPENWDFLKKQFFASNCSGSRPPWGLPEQLPTIKVGIEWQYAKMDERNVSC